jgi:hypothetical protein
MRPENYRMHQGLQVMLRRTGLIVAVQLQRLG